jgi:hypothetical protein
MSDTKKILITGTAVTEQGLGPSVGKKRRTSRKQQGGADAKGEPNNVPPVANAPPLLITPTPVPVPAAAAAPAPAAAIPPPQQANIPPALRGGAKTKVVLEPPKKTAAKLVASKSKTRKAKKIRVSLTGLGKRITRHKKIQKEARSYSIEDIKKTLVAAKLIKPDSKAPESILRQIYADYQTLKNKAL